MKKFLIMTFLIGVTLSSNNSISFAKEINTKTNISENNTKNNFKLKVVRTLKLTPSDINDDLIKLYTNDGWEFDGKSFTREVTYKDDIIKIGDTDYFSDNDGYFYIDSLIFEKAYDNKSLTLVGNNTDNYSIETENDGTIVINFTVDMNNMPCNRYDKNDRIQKMNNEAIMQQYIDNPMINNNMSYNSFNLVNSLPYYAINLFNNQK